MEVRISDPDLKKGSNAISTSPKQDRLTENWSLYSKLDPTTSAVDRELHPSPSQRYRFKGLELDRQLVYSALMQLYANETPVRNFEKCGDQSFVVYSPSRGRFEVRANGCNQRVCPKCRYARSAKWGRSIENLLGEVKPLEWRFLTLTLKHSPTPLFQQLDRLQASFRKLRQRKFWKSCADGGVAVIEVTFNVATNEWHPHLHILVKGVFIDMFELSRQWRDITGDSFIIKPVEVEDGPRAAHYLAKYLGKAPGLSKAKEPIFKTGEWIIGMKNRKMMYRFGNALLPLDDCDLKDPDEGFDDWEMVGSLDSLLARAAGGERSANSILEALSSSTIIACDEDQPT